MSNTSLMESFDKVEVLAKQMGEIDGMTIAAEIAVELARENSQSQEALGVLQKFVTRLHDRLRMNSNLTVKDKEES